MNYTEILEKLKSFRHDIMVEELDVRNGTKPEMNLNAIFEKYKAVYSKEAIDHLKELYTKETDAVKKDQIKRVLFDLISSYYYSKTTKRGEK